MNRNLIALSIAAVLGTASTLAAAFPAVGEFSAADASLTYTASNVTRAEVRQAAADNNHAVVNGEIVTPAATAHVTPTRAQVREEGRQAARAGTIATGDLSM